MSIASLRTELEREVAAAALSGSVLSPETVVGALAGTGAVKRLVRRHVKPGLAVLVEFAQFYGGVDNVARHRVSAILWASRHIEFGPLTLSVENFFRCVWKHRIWDAR